MEHASAYLPQDRRTSIQQRRSLPERAPGAVLFADISGFTPLTSALVQYVGARRGADLLTRQLNEVYTALIDQVDCYGGSVIGFSGDAITCWFPAPTLSLDGPEHDIALVEAILRATASALAMQRAMTRFHAARINERVTVNLAIKTAVAAGVTRRFVVGDPQIQRIDVLAGTTLERMAAADAVAQKGELVLDAQTAAYVRDQVTIEAWRTGSEANQRFAVVTSLQTTVTATPLSDEPLPLTDEQARPWVLPTLHTRLQSEQSRFLAELRPATALFLKFAGLDFDHDAEAGVKLDAYIRWVQGVVDRYEGALIQLTTGDKGSYLYAAFGAPIAHDDDCLRAVTAALALRTPPAHCAFITSTQIGLSQGLMRVGAYGSASRRTYGVLGDETVVAARLMSAAGPGQIYASAAIAEVVADHVHLHPLGAFKLKGKPEPQPVFAVIGLYAGPGQRLSKLYAAPLVGRQRELAQMTALLEVLAQGEGRLLRIEGSAGIGKSHLVATFVRQAEAAGFALALAACQSTTQDMAYFTGRQLAHALFRLEETDAETEQINQIEITLAALNPAWLMRMPLLGDLLGLPIPDNPTTAAFDPRLRQEALISLVVDIVQARARQKALVLLFEDIHWMDEASQGMLLALARVVTTAPILLVLVQRPPNREEEGFLAAVTALPHQLHIVLSELEPEGLAVLLQNRLNGAIAPLPLALIQAQTQGNPFFAEELVDALRDAGHLLLHQGVWTLAQDLVDRLHHAGCLQMTEAGWTLAPAAPLAAVDLGIPGTVQGIVLSRLDRLPAAAKLTLKVASVIGAVFDYELLVRVHPLRNLADALHQHMSVLLARDFARVETPEPRLSYIFKHNITQEVAYQTLLEEQRYDLHLAVADELAELQPDKIEALAFHYAHSDLRRPPVRAKALRYLDEAGQRAKRDYANETALGYFNRLLALEARWPWLKAKIEILHILGRREEQKATLALLEAAPNAPPFDAAYLWAQYHEAVSQYEAAQAAIERALLVCRASADRRGELRCLAFLGQIARRYGHYEAAKAHYAQALRVLGDEPAQRNEAGEILHGLGIVDRQQGRYNEAQVQFEKALEFYRQSNNRPKEANTLIALGTVAHLRRDYQRMTSYLQEALTICKLTGDRTGEGGSLLSLGQALRSAGSYSEAEALLGQALTIQQAVNNPWLEIRVWNELGIVHMLVGDLIQAEQSFQRGLQLGQKVGDEEMQAIILLNLGQVMGAQGNLAAAEALLNQSLQMARVQGDKELEAQSWSDLAITSLRAGRFEQAAERATTALDLLRKLGLFLSTTTDLTSLATSYLSINDYPRALDYAHQALKILDACQGEGPDYPQRDYFICYQVLMACHQPDEARRALNAAYALLMKQASKITAPNTRRSYLENIEVNRAIIQMKLRDGD